MGRECAEIYVRNLELQEEQRRDMMEQREKGRNTRQEMIAREMHYVPILKCFETCMVI